MSTKDNEQMAFSDFNLQKINTKEYAEILRGAIQTGSNVAVFGRRGSGKTEIAKQQIRETKVELDGKETHVKEVYLNLSVAERTDMGGYPDMFGVIKDSEDKKKSRFVDIILPQFFAPLIEGDQPCVALLDEVDKADPAIWAPLLEIVQFKTINGRPLKNLRSVVMTGNLISEGGRKPSPPLLDRSEKYIIEADATLWLDWAGKSGEIHPSITAYINDHHSDLFGPVDLGENYADPSPRGWHLASKVLFEGERLNWSPDLLNMKVSGFVGKRAGLEYSIYFSHYRVLLPLVNKLFESGPSKDIVKEYDSLEPGKQLIACMIVCSRLASILDAASPKKLPKELGYVGKFLSHASPENVLVSIRTQLQLRRLVRYDLDTNPDWKDLIQEINKSIRYNA